MAKLRRSPGDPKLFFLSHLLRPLLSWKPSPRHTPWSCFHSTACFLFTQVCVFLYCTRSNRLARQLKWSSRRISRTIKAFTCTFKRTFWLTGIVCPLRNLLILRSSSVFFAHLLPVYDVKLQSAAGGCDCDRQGIISDGIEISHHLTNDGRPHVQRMWTNTIKTCSFIRQLADIWKWQIDDFMSL